MADTWWAYGNPTLNATPKYMMAIRNAGAKVLKIQRIMFMNYSVGAVTGILAAGNIDRYTGSTSVTAGTTVTPVAKDGNNTALDTVTIVHSPTAVGGTPATFRRWLWSTDEPAVSTVTLDELQAITGGWVMWDVGYDNANLQPLTIRNGEMLLVQATAYSSTAAGVVDIYIEFTSE